MPQRRNKRVGIADRKLVMFTIAVSAVTLLMVACTDGQAPAELPVMEGQSADVVLRHSILELSFKHHGNSPTQFFDVTLDVVFTAPSGVQRHVKGFYYGSDVWKVRFRPDEPGRWTYTYVMAAKSGVSKQGDGAFDCTPSDAEGPVRRHPENPYRWIFANGEPYFPVGLQDCIDFRDSHLIPKEIDGETSRNAGRRISLEDYFSIYGQAGFNLFRFSQRNCSYPLYDDFDSYREAESLATDQLLAMAREHGFRVMFGFFGFHDQWPPDSFPVRLLKRTLRTILRTRDIWAPSDEHTIAGEKRFIDYAVARWGVYVDFWELLNERRASDEWTTLMAEYVRAIDPDRKPIGTSWEKPHLPAIDLNTPHWYESESELQSDMRVHQQAERWKQPGKPVIVGEQGNRGMNWDPLSSLRMRIRTWTALFQDISLILWNTSWSKTGMFYGRPRPRRAANIYLGPEERGYIRVLRDFASQLDADVQMVPVEVSPPHSVRAYGLRSRTVAAVYLHHFEHHTAVVHGVHIRLDLPGAAGSSDELVGQWIDPSSGEVVAHVGVPPGRQTLHVPPLLIDLALLVTGEPDRLRPRRAGNDPTPHARTSERP